MVLSRQFAAILFVWPLFGEVIYAQSHTLKGSIYIAYNLPYKSALYLIIWTKGLNLQNKQTINLQLFTP